MLNTNHQPQTVIQASEWLLLTPQEVADRLRCSVDLVRAHASGRKLPKLRCARVGKLMRFRWPDVEQFIADQVESAAPTKTRVRIQ